MLVIDNSLFDRKQTKGMCVSTLYGLRRWLLEFVYFTIQTAQVVIVLSWNVQDASFVEIARGTVPLTDEDFCSDFHAVEWIQSDELGSYFSLAERSEANRVQHVAETRSAPNPLQLAEICNISVDRVSAVAWGILEYVRLTSVIFPK